MPILLLLLLAPADDAPKDILSTTVLIQDLSGDPIEGVRITGKDFYGPNGREKDLGTIATTDAYGVADIQRPRSQPMWLTAEKEGYLPVRLTLKWSGERPNFDAAIPTTMQRGVRPWVKIVDEAGDPVPGIRFQWAYAGATETQPPFAKQPVSDDDGLMRLPRIPSGEKIALIFAGNDQWAPPPVDLYAIPDDPGDEPLLTLTASRGIPIAFEPNGFADVAEIEIDTYDIDVMSDGILVGQLVTHVHDFGTGPLTVRLHPGKTQFETRLPKDAAAGDPVPVLVDRSRTEPPEDWRHGLVTLTDATTLAVESRETATISGRLVSDYPGEIFVSVECESPSDLSIQSTGIYPDESGTFSFTLPRSRYGVRLFGMRGPARKLATSRPPRHQVDFTQSNADAVDLGDWPVVLMPSITGQVVDKRGRPIAGAIVNHTVATQPAAKLTAGDDGRFSISPIGLTLSIPRFAQYRSVTLEASDPATGRTGEATYEFDSVDDFDGLRVVVE